MKESPFCLIYKITENFFCLEGEDIPVDILGKVIEDDNVILVSTTFAHKLVLTFLLLVSLQKLYIHILMDWHAQISVWAQVSCGRCLLPRPLLLYCFSCFFLYNFKHPPYLLMWRHFLNICINLLFRYLLVSTSVCHETYQN